MQALAGLVLVVVHGWLFVTCSALPRVETVGGLGAALIALGVWIAAGPFIRDGAAALARSQVQGPAFTYLFSEDMIAEISAEHDRKLASARRDVLLVGGVAAAVAVIGTLINGYSGMVARLLASASGLGDCA